MNLSQQNIHDLNTVARWLAEDDLNAGDQQIDSGRRTPVVNAEIMILAGHAILPNITGAFDLLAATSLPVLFSGGVGHSTGLLKQALASASRYAHVTTTADSEAEMLADAAEQGFDVPRERLLIENLSRNCGENADFSLTFLQKNGAVPERILLVQDPLMQRRTTATFRTAWARRGMNATFISWPVFVPYLALRQGECVIAGADTQEGLWQLDRYVSMILGEVKRLRDDENGYGPAGMGFIDHLDIPPEVEEASQRLAGSAGLAGLVR
ncbi:YdcF family protein [Pantoea sp. BAV 3049]|uniref:YdcF family protein n=1 Tax=Pantoea sp. BAV 3049 TaxID=2654188 RepID=UPI00131E5E55|nr:YdcF family protein [Pantoea sp. BAV 3049]